MFKNDYGPLIEKWKIDLIVSRAKRLGFRRQDLEDAQQQIVIELLEFAFDPARSNGATEETAVTALIDHQLLTLRRSRARYAERVTASDDQWGSDESLIADDSIQEQVATNTDIATGIAQLSPLARQICEALSDGLSVNETAQRLGVGWHTVERQVRSIRECFRRLGIDDGIPA